MGENMKLPTNNEIVNSLTACAVGDCVNCSIHDDDTGDCVTYLMAAAAKRMDEMIIADRILKDTIMIESDGERRMDNQSVKHPQHYNSGKIEVWDAIVDWGLGFLLGNVIKYAVRAGKKGDRLEDLLKCREYIDKAIDVERKERENDEVAEKFD